MPRTKQKMPPNQPPHDVAYRAVTFHADDRNDEERSIKVTLATEAGVDTYDWQRGVIKEHLMMSGAKLPKQVPLVDSHNHDSVRNILGSIRDLEIKETQAGGRRLVGRAYFGTKPAAIEAFNDIREGHLTDISVGAFRLQEKYIDPDKEKEVDGMRIKGPARVVNRWQPFEGSAVTVGADRHSTFGSIPALRAYTDPFSMKEEAMNETYRNTLVELGMPAELDDDAAAEWAKSNLQRKQEQPKEEISERLKAAPEVEKILDGGDHKTTERVDPQAIIRQATERAQAIRKSARMAGLDDVFADTLVEDLSLDIGSASQRILRELGSRRKPVGAGIEPTGSEKESFRKVVLDGLSMRFGAQVEKPAPEAREFRHTRFLDLVRRCLDREEPGVSKRFGGDDYALVRYAFSHGVSARASDGQGYIVSGTLSNLMLDAQNKRLLQSFDNTPSTYQVWARQAESVPDFKDINRIRLSEIGNQPMVPENGDYKDMSLSDSKESYRVEKYGSMISLSWEAMKNDDLSGFSRIVQLQGAAMRRTINKSVYQILFDNPTLSDSVALFHATSHGANLDTNDLSIANLSVGWNVMMLQTGLNSDVILGIQPRYLLVSATDSAAAEQILGSFADPGAGGSAAGNSNSLNIYGPGGPRRLTLVVEPLIDGNDSDSWYLAADPNVVDTIEYTFLQGEETPVFEQETAFVQDAIKYKVRQTWGVKAIDYRGLYKSSGSG